VFYFPIATKLRSLLKTQEYFELIQHEFERPSNPDYVTDVYDTPAWQKFMGPVKYPNKRIGLQMCVDGIPAFAADTYSLKPLAFLNLSLSPTIRGKMQFVLLMMLLPATLKDGQKKYYDFAAEYELNRLSSEGVGGVKIKIFGTSLDTKGREELLGMQACQAYQSCWVCTHSWSPGRLVRRRQCIFDGYRAFLTPNSRARRRTFKFKGIKYQYRWVCLLSIIVCCACLHVTAAYITHSLSYVLHRCAETRPNPTRRDEDFVRTAVALATRAQPFAGHKTPPLLCRWPDWGWYRMNIPDLMHGTIEHLCN